MADEAHVLSGHKATLHNPNVSEEAKEHSKEILKEHDALPDAKGAVEHHASHSVSEGEHKNPGNVVGGLKAAINNPNVSEEAKEHAQERLDAI